MATKALFSIAWAGLSWVVYWLLDHFLYSWLVQYLERVFDVKEANVIASVSSYVIPALLAVVIIWVVYLAGRRWQPVPKPVMSEIDRRALIAEARDLVVRLVRQYPDSAQFEKQLASAQIFYKLRPYFSEHFNTIRGRMVTYPSW
jgi:hypothetical protein